MSSPTPSLPSARRWSITVRGVVQGVGFRPFVYNLARAMGLSGWVCNEADCVCIEVAGDAAAVARFRDALRADAPAAARIEDIDVVEVTAAAAADDAPLTFTIRISDGQASPRPTIPADLATCPECLAEINNPAERRYRYPFTNCTNCGPRWSIIRALPYDRPRTSMAEFAMCPACQAEYDNPADRRFHAQPIACPVCGPRLQFLDPEGKELAVGDAALKATVAALGAGQVVAFKGLGGFQLLVDATQAAAVACLRQRKHRPDRPFAVMLPSLEAVRQCCDATPAEVELLTAPQAPIVLLRRRPETINGAGLPVDGVAPGNPYLGVMLPYTPLHHLLLQGIGRALVCTSGNLAEDPMAVTTADAIKRLGTVADVLLTHNRPIVRPVDDSVVRVGETGPQVLRRARGYAPLPLEVSCHVATGDDAPQHAKTPTILAVGGHLKNTVALCLGGAVATEDAAAPSAVQQGRAVRVPVVLSAHIGDLDNVRSVAVFRSAIDDLLAFYQAQPDAVVCDLHPDYASTRHAEALAERWRVPLLRVQHHHAHVAACMAEHDLHEPVLGFAWDGVGYGPDGTVWGGEALLCEGAGYRRAAHLRHFSLPGGDRAAREPRRAALGVLSEILGADADKIAAAWFTPSQLESLYVMLARGLHSPRTSSMGRLFDAVAAICGLPPVISFEGQAAMALEYAADVHETGAYEFALTDDVLDWAPVVRAVLADRAAGVPVGLISARFHNALAAVTATVARAVGCPRVALTGGCFQNALLAARVRRRLSDEGFRVYTQKRVPPGDGGVALGQILLAIRQQ